MNEARQGLVARVKAVEREREALKGARDAAAAFLERERECLVSQCAIFQVTLTVVLS